MGLKSIIVTLIAIKSVPLILFPLIGHQNSSSQEMTGLEWHLKFGNQLSDGAEFRVIVMAFTL